MSTVVRIHGCGGLWRCDWYSWNTDEENQLVESDARDPFNDGRALPQSGSLRFCVYFTVTSRIGRAHGIHETRPSLIAVDNAFRHRLWIAACSQCLRQAQHSSKVYLRETRTRCLVP
jgi:hypothetical protein